MTSKGAWVLCKRCLPLQPEPSVTATPEDTPTPTSTPTPERGEASDAEETPEQAAVETRVVVRAATPTPTPALPGGPLAVVYPYFLSD